MSRNIYWQPDKKNPEYLNIGHIDKFVHVSCVLGHDLPDVFTEEDIPTLRALCAATDESGYQQLINAIEKHGRVRV